MLLNPAADATFAASLLQLATEANTVSFAPRWQVSAFFQQLHLQGIFIVHSLYSSITVLTSFKSGYIFNCRAIHRAIYKGVPDSTPIIGGKRWLKSSRLPGASTAMIFRGTPLSLNIRVCVLHVHFIAQFITRYVNAHRTHPQVLRASRLDGRRRPRPSCPAGII